MLRVLINSIFVIYLVLFSYINVFVTESALKNYFTDSFYILELVAFVTALYVARDWYYKATTVGTSFLFFSFAFLSQFIGHLFYTLLFLFTGVENPYLNFGDYFFIISSVLFLFGCCLLLKEWYSQRQQFSFRLFLIITAGYFGIFVLVLSFLYPLLITREDSFGFLRFLMEFVLPAAEVSILSVLTVYIFYSKKIYLGILRQNLLMLSVATFVQFANDIFFYFQTYTGTWSPAGLNDLLYLLIYYLHCMSMLRTLDKTYREHHFQPTYYYL